jgi:hypothetical protein
MSDILNRPGRVYVSRDVLQDNPDEVREILGQILITDARARMIQNDIEYSGYSEQFEEQEDHNNIPVYDINITQDDDGNMSVEFVKDE